MRGWHMSQFIPVILHKYESGVNRVIRPAASDYLSGVVEGPARRLIAEHASADAT
jgi:hypothetical protein